MKASATPRLSLFKSLSSAGQNAKIDEPSSGYPGGHPGTVMYAVGDIHGRSDLLLKVFNHIDADKEALADSVHHSTEIYLGDYIDRGPDSAGVVEMLIDRGRRVPCVFVRGNHETMLLNVLDGRISVSAVMNWLKFGGASAALSYGLTNIPREYDDLASLFVQQLREAIPEAHKAFLQSTVEYFNAYDYVFAHAGIRPGIPLANQTYDDLSTIRDGFLDSDDDYGFVVVHGHTPTMEPEFLPNRINIDTGAYATGILTCLKIDGGGPKILT